MEERTPQTPPRILPLAPGIERPLWSVMIPAYNCSRYLGETIKSVLAQTSHLPQMQIEVIDDKSTDADVSDLVKLMGEDKVAYFCQEKNVGSLRNFETCINRARGHWVHILHGDDRVAPGFYTEIQNLFETCPQAGAAITGVIFIDEEGAFCRENEKLQQEPGILPGWLEKIATQNLVQPPAVVVRRSVYEHLGSFFGVHYGEDWEMWTRIAAHYPVAYSPKALAYYRYLRSDAISQVSVLNGDHTRDMLRVIETIQAYLPPLKRAALSRTARRKYSKYAASCAQIAYAQTRNKAIVRAAAKSAIRMHLNPTTLVSLLKLETKIFLDAVGMRKGSR